MHVWRNIPGKYITDKYIIDKAARFCNHSGEQYPSDYSVPVRLFCTRPYILYLSDCSVLTDYSAPDQLFCVLRLFFTLMYDCMVSDQNVSAPPTE